MSPSLSLYLSLSLSISLSLHIYICTCIHLLCDLCRKCRFYTETQIRSRILRAIFRPLTQPLYDIQKCYDWAKDNRWMSHAKHPVL